MTSVTGMNTLRRMIGADYASLTFRSRAFGSPGFRTKSAISPRLYAAISFSPASMRRPTGLLLGFLRAAGFLGIYSVSHVI